MKIILEKEYSFANAFFWDVILHHHIQAVDEEKDENNSKNKVDMGEQG